MHKTAFELGSLAVTWYGILVATGFLAGMWTASRRGLRDRLHPETVFDLGPWLLVGAIVGARVDFVISYWHEAKFDVSPIWEIFMVQRGGLVYYGGLIGASLATIIYISVKKLPLWKVADTLAPSIALGSAIGRWGCLMTGCCFGKPCSVPWGIQFPYDSPAWNQQYDAGLVHPGMDSLPVHPTQIYDSLLNFALYAGLAWLYRRKKFDGQIFALYLVGYAIIRSFVEQFRGDYAPVHYFHGWLTPGQLLSVFGIAIGALLLWKLPRPAANVPLPAPAPAAKKA